MKSFIAGVRPKMSVQLRKGGGSFISQDLWDRISGLAGI